MISKYIFKELMYLLIQIFIVLFSYINYILDFNTPHYTYRRDGMYVYNMYTHLVIVIHGNQHNLQVKTNSNTVTRSSYSRRACGLVLIVGENFLQSGPLILEPFRNRVIHRPRRHYTTTIRTSCIKKKKCFKAFIYDYTSLQSWVLLCIGIFK